MGIIEGFVWRKANLTSVLNLAQSGEKPPLTGGCLHCWTWCAFGWQGDGH